MKKTLFFILMVLALCGCSNSTQGNDVEVIIDSTQFSGITSDELVNIMGEPESIEDYEWSIPKTNESVIGKLYIYEKNKFEFVLFDDIVARLNVYSGSYWGYDNSSFEFSTGKEVLKSFGISDTYKNIQRTDNTGYMERYKPVSDGIDEVEIYEIIDDKFSFIHITYDSDYYD